MAYYIYTAKPFFFKQLCGILFYAIIGQILSSIPTATEIAYTVPINSKLRFHCLVFFKSTTNPMPAFAHNPAAHAPKVIPPDKKASVITTLDAQLGINPIKQVKIG